MICTIFQNVADQLQAAQEAEMEHVGDSSSALVAAMWVERRPLLRAHVVEESNGVTAGLDSWHSCAFGRSQYL